MLAFQNGFMQVRQRDVSAVRKKIKSILRLGSDPAMWNRINGIVSHTPAERAAIEAIFAEYGITDVWGTV